MKFTCQLLALSLTLAAVTMVPVSAADKEQRQMMADIRMLQEQQQQIQTAVVALTEALKGFDGRLGARFDQQAESSRKSLADQKLIIDNISRDLGVLREKVDDGNVRAGTISQEVDALRELVQQATLSRPPAAPEFGAEPQPASVPSLENPGPAGGNQPGGVAALGSSPAKLFESASADYGAAQYDLAILGYEAYIKSFPKSDMADDAQVAICNSFINEGKYDKASQACDLAIRTYPTGNAVPEAYYKKGLALQNLKQTDAAREAYQTLVQKYPESAAATLANQKLVELKKP